MFGFQLNRVQQGLTPVIRWENLGTQDGQTLHELKENEGNGTYRCVYTILGGEIVVVLVAWKKKSKRGRAMEPVIRQRLGERLKEVVMWFRTQTKGGGDDAGRVP